MQQAKRAKSKGVITFDSTAFDSSYKSFGFWHWWPILQIGQKIQLQTWAALAVFVNLVSQ
jgi:hypothetical protein